MTISSLSGKEEANKQTNQKMTMIENESLTQQGEKENTASVSTLPTSNSNKRATLLSRQPLSSSNNSNNVTTNVSATTTKRKSTHQKSRTSFLKRLDPRKHPYLKKQQQLAPLKSKAKSTNASSGLWHVSQSQQRQPEDNDDDDDTLGLLFEQIRDVRQDSKEEETDEIAQALVEDSLVYSPSTQNSNHKEPEIVANDDNKQDDKKQTTPPSHKEVPSNNAPDAEEEEEEEVAPLKRSKKSSIPKRILPRIDSSMTLQQLQQEATCRGIYSFSVSQNKDELLQFLVKGSIRVGATAAYREYQSLLEQVELEKPGLEREQQERERQAHERKARLRAAEVARQTKLHVYSFPGVHAHPLAKAKELSCHGRARCEAKVCQQCNHELDKTCWAYDEQHVIQWSCETCDFDLCQPCFLRCLDRVQEEERAREATQQQQQQQQQQSTDKNNVQEEKTDTVKPLVETNDKDKGYRWDPPNVQQKQVVFPSAKNTLPGGSLGQGFTVYCSYGQTASKQEFDSTWETEEEALARARYLYHWKNCWSFEEEKEEQVPSEIRINGAAGAFFDKSRKYGVHERARSCWSVGVVADQEFAQMMNATETRHKRDIYSSHELEKEEQNENANKMDPKELDRQWDASMLFDKSILYLSDQQMEQQGNNGQGFTVWCSFGFVNHEWYNNQGCPNQEFDSTWKTLQEANDRAKYLFYWQNCWGLRPHELQDFSCRGGQPPSILESSSSDGLHLYSMEPEDMECWTVGVVADADYPQLPKATMERHLHDAPDPILMSPLTPPRGFGKFDFDSNQDKDVIGRDHSMYYTKIFI